MHNERQGVNLFSVHQDIQLCQVALPVFDQFVVKGAVSLSDRLQSVVEVKDDFGKRHVELDFNPGRRRIGDPWIDPAALQAQFHHHAHVALKKGSDLTGQVTGDRGRVDDSAWGSLSGLPFVSFRNEKLRSRGD